MKIGGYEIVYVAYELRYPTQFKMIGELGNIAESFQGRLGEIRVEGHLVSGADNFQVRITPNNIIIFQEKGADLKLIQDEISALITQISRIVKIDKFERSGIRLLLQKDGIDNQLVSKIIFNELLTSEKWKSLSGDCKLKQLVFSFSENTIDHTISIHTLEPIIYFDIDYGIHSPEKPFDVIVGQSTKYIEHNLLPILKLF